MAKRRVSKVHGLVLVDKPSGMTSHDVVNRLRRILDEKRIGHAGTLDPGATGVLVVGVGNGTRLLRFLGDLDKEYECEIVFGAETDSLDDDGLVTRVHDAPTPTLDAIRSMIADRFHGHISQVPPMVSALKVDGKRLHELARQGIEVDRQPRQIEVTRFDVEQTSDPVVVKAHIECSSGSYVRSLGADLATALGTGAHIRKLRRLRVGPYRLSECRPLESPEVLNMLEILRGVTRVTVDQDTIDAVNVGTVFPAWDGDGPWALVDVAGELIAVYEPWRNNLAKPTVALYGK